MQASFSAHAHDTMYLFPEASIGCGIACMQSIAKTRTLTDVLIFYAYEHVQVHRRPRPRDSPKPAHAQPHQTGHVFVVGWISIHL